MSVFEPVGDLFTDLQTAIETETIVFITYTAKNGEYTERTIAPLELRGQYLYAADLEKMGLRMFIIGSIGSYEITDETFDKDGLSLT